MNIIILIFAFFIGSCFWSFWSVLLSRLEKITRPNIKSILIGRSQCPQCKKTLTRSQLIPLYSYYRQSGQCKNCRQKIANRYPRTELLCGTVFALTTFLRRQNGWNVTQTNNLLLFRLLINRLLSLIAIYDLRTQYLHSALRYICTTIVILELFISQSFSFSDIFITTTTRIIGLGSIYLWWKYYAQKRYQREEWFGFGDVMMGWTIGLLIPYICSIHDIHISRFNSIALFLVFICLASCIGLIHFAIQCLLSSKKENQTAQIAFLPSMIISFWFLVVWAEKLLQVLFG